MTIERTLRQAQSSGDLVAVFTNQDDPDWCSVGYVDLITEEYVRLREVTPDGKLVGVEVRSLARIFRVTTTKDDEHVRKVARLASVDGNVIREQRLTGEEANPILDALRLSFEDRTLVTLLYRDEDFTGYVAKMADGAVSLMRVGPYGKPEGETVIRTAEIDALVFGTVDEQEIQFLMRDESPRRG